VPVAVRSASAGEPAWQRWPADVPPLSLPLPRAPPVA
jgi:hypothetical protein